MIKNKLLLFCSVLFCSVDVFTSLISRDSVNVPQRIIVFSREYLLQSCNGYVDPSYYCSDINKTIKVLFKEGGDISMITAIPCSNHHYSNDPYKFRFHGGRWQEFKCCYINERQQIVPSAWVDCVDQNIAYIPESGNK